jgi:hypothetical protein
MSMNTVQKQEYTTRNERDLKRWSGWPDSNQRPSAPKADALPS